VARQGLMETGGCYLMDVLRDWWALAMAGVAGLFWLSRLEWRGLQNEAEIKRLWAQRKEDLQAAQRARDETNEIWSGRHRKCA
jgi:hypothetical protein